MFEEDYTFSIIAFINSIIRLNMINDCGTLLTDAINELERRVPLVAKSYECDERLDCIKEHN